MTIRRMKTYTGQTGFVYQYYFVGKREALPEAPERPAMEYVFDVTSDRHSTYAVSVFLRDEARHLWADAHGRELNEAEQYATAKLRLFAAFDEVEDMASSGRRLVIGPENIESLLEPLDLG
jgi:hypothetical protein